MAAALSYRTIFGLIPVMVVALIALKSFTSDEDLADAVTRAMQYSGLSSIAVDESPQNMGPFPEDEGPGAPGEQGAGGEQAASDGQGEVGGEGAGHVQPESGSQRLDQWIRELVSRVGSINFKAIGLIGLMALLYAAIAMLVEVERAFNQIYRVPVGRSWVRRITHYWTLLTLGTLGLFLTFYVGQRFATELINAASWAGADKNNAILLGVVGYFSTTVISTLLFLLVYTVVPNTRVKFGPALAGAIFAALAWEAGKWGFTQYLRFSTGYARLYGSIALFPLFLLWVYFTWCIVLYGLNIAYYLQHGRFKTEARPVEAVNPGVVDPGTALTLVAALARQFEKGEPVEHQALAHRMGLQDAIVVQMLDRMAAAGVVNKVVREGQDGLFALARPPERISAEEVLRIGEELITTPCEETDPIARSMREARKGLVRGRSMADLMEAPDAGEGPGSPRRDASPVPRPATV
jgi:membrane protein